MARKHEGVLRLLRGEPVEAVEGRAVADLLAAGFRKVDYVEARVPETLERLDGDGGDRTQPVGDETGGSLCL